MFSTVQPREERPVLMNEKLINMKLSLYVKRMGPDILELSPEQALELAIQAEDYRKPMSVDDPAFEYFVQQEFCWIEIASLLEKRALCVKQTQAMVGPATDA